MVVAVSVAYLQYAAFCWGLASQANATSSLSYQSKASGGWKEVGQVSQEDVILSKASSK